MEQSVQAFLTTNNIPTTIAGSELIVSCPFCSHLKPKCYINAYSGQFYCFICGTGGKWQFFAEKIGKADAAVSLVAVPPEVEDDPTPIDPDDVIRNHENLMKGSGRMLLSEYFYKKRGLDDVTLQKFQIGWDGKSIIIPIFNAKGQCLNFKLKPDPTRLSGNTNMFQLSGRGKNRLFNEEVLLKKQERVIIAEGEWDAMMLTKHGYAAVSVTGGAMSNFNPSWVSSFDRVEKIYICYDNDLNTTGQRGAEKLAKVFTERGRKVFLIQLPSPYHNETKVDVTDFFHKRKHTKKDFTVLLVNADEYTGKQTLGALYEFVSGRKLLETEYPEQKWLVDHFIPVGGMSCLSAAEGSYKSWLSHYMALCILRGDPFLDQFPVKRGKVLFIDKENTFPFIKERLVMLGAKANELDNLYFMKGNFMANQTQDIAQVCNFIETERIDLVVIDTLVRVHNLDENKAGDMAQVFEHLREFQMRDAAVLVIHHLKKNNTDNHNPEIRDLLRGSSDISARVETHFSLQAKDAGNIKMTIAKNRHEEKMQPLVMEFLTTETTATFRNTGRVTLDMGIINNIQNSIIVFLQADEDAWFSRSMIAEGIGRHKENKNVGEALKRLLEQKSSPLEYRKGEEGDGSGSPQLYKINKLWVAQQKLA